MLHNVQFKAMSQAGVSCRHKAYIDNFDIHQEEHKNNIITKLEDKEELIQ